MSATLTSEDLQAIGRIVRPIVAEVVTGVVTKVVTEAVEELSQRTAAGFAEVHAKFDAMDERFESIEVELASVKHTVENIERVQRAEIERVDQHEKAINKMRKAMQAV